MTHWNWRGFFQGVLFVAVACALYVTSWTLADYYAHKGSASHLTVDQSQVLAELPLRLQIIERDTRTMSDERSAEWAKINAMIEQRISEEDHKRLVQLPLKIGNIEARLASLEQQLNRIQRED